MKMLNIPYFNVFFCLLVVHIGLVNQVVVAQKFATRNGNVSFFSKAPLENIEAVNQQVSAIFDFSKSEAVFQVLMKGFVFKKALMQEHFNENYVESHKYPKATFQGKIIGGSITDFQKNALNTISIDGVMEMHGVKKQMKASGTIEVKEGKIYIKSKFNLKPKDFNIKIPSAVNDNIAETIEVTLFLVCSPLSK